MRVLGRTLRQCERQREIVREGALPEWAETVSAPRAFAHSTRPAGTRPSRHSVRLGYWNFNLLFSLAEKSVARITL